MHALKPRSRGITLIEIAVVIAVIGILGSMLLSRSRFYQEQAEKVSVEQTLSILRSAMHLQLAGKVANGKDREITQLVQQNPMSWLSEKPNNYVGEFYSPKPGIVQNGNWYFDPHDQNLVYMVINQEHLQTKDGEANRLRFRARLFPLEAGVNGGPIEGVVLEPVVAYSWF
jgi:prepilin-type N-terminal cleavage/methylation domain-containing protein